MLPVAASLPRFRAVPRAHAADHVGEELALAVLRGELAPGAALPSERVLAERFGVSRIIARQGVHQLASLGLARVHQGSATVVLDPKEHGDLRVLALLYRMGGPRAIDPRDITEKQLLQGLGLIDSAARRASKKERARVAGAAQKRLAACHSEEDYLAFEERFWRDVASISGNRILQMEIAYWYRALPSMPRAEAFVPSPLAVRVGFYRELARRLGSGEDASGYYRVALEPLLSALFAKQIQAPGRKKRGS